MSNSTIPEKLTKDQAKVITEVLSKAKIYLSDATVQQMYKPNYIPLAVQIEGIFNEHDIDLN